MTVLLSLENKKGNPKRIAFLFEPQRDRTFDPQIKSLLLYQLS